jgi:hypothetical protein
MSAILGLEHGTRLEGLPEDLPTRDPHETLQELERLGLIDSISSAILRQYLTMRVLAFRFHPVRCTTPPLLQREVGGKIPWQSVGNTFLFVQTGRWKEEAGKSSLVPTPEKEAPDGVWCEFCLKAA